MCVYLACVYCSTIEHCINTLKYTQWLYYVLHVTTIKWLFWGRGSCVLGVYCLHSSARQQTQCCARQHKLSKITRVTVAWPASIFDCISLLETRQMFYNQLFYDIKYTVIVKWSWCAWNNISASQCTILYTIQFRRHTVRCSAPNQTKNQRSQNAFAEIEGADVPSMLNSALPSYIDAIAAAAMNGERFLSQHFRNFSTTKEREKQTNTKK